MKNNYLHRLQNWYQANCNGDWEHSYGIKIETLDNPGWHITIDLEETCLQNAEINISEEKDEDDWYIIKTENHKYIGAGDFNKLYKILEVFFEEFLTKKKDENFLYEIYLPVSGSNKIFKPVYAAMINQDLFQIKKINSLDEEKKNIKFMNLEDLKELDNITEDTQYNINDTVRCRLKTFFNGVGLGAYSRVKLSGMPKDE